MSRDPSGSHSLSWLARCFMALAALMVTAGASDAQVIRGTVTERQGGLPVAGALVTVVRDTTGLELSDSTLRTVTDAEGRFVIAPRSAGTYRLTIRRIGVQPHVVPVQVGDGETRTVAIEVDRVTQAMPVIAVSDSSMCVSRGAVAGRVAALWEAARTALYVMVDADSSGILGQRLVRYTRIRDARSFAVLEEEFHSYDDRDGLREARFTSVPADTLSRHGYWRESGSSTVYNAPDAHVLLSNTFLREHCFGVTDGEGENAGHVGLTFEPVRSRRLPDVKGVLWLDQGTHELRTLTVEWTALPVEVRHDRVGAELHYARLPTGEWLIRRWSMTMPRLVTRTTISRGSGRITRRTALAHLVEEGGMSYVFGLAGRERSGTVTGEVVYNNKPLRWSRVRLLGTPYTATVDSSGRFRFDSVPPGPHAVVVQHAQYDALSIRAAEQEFLLDEGERRHLKLVTPSTRAAGNIVCPGRDFRWAVLRATVVDRLTLQPLTGVALRLEWLERLVEGLIPTGEFSRPAVIERMHEIGRDAITDERGIATFCNVAPARELTLRLLGYDFELPPLGTFTLGAQENGSATVRLTLPKGG